MKSFFGVSCMTFFLLSSLSLAGTLGTLESEIETLEGEVAKAQNERDALLLKPEAGKNNPAVQTKTEALEEKKRALRERMKDLNTRPKTVAKDPSQLGIDADLLSTQPDPNDRDDTPRGNAPLRVAPAVETPIRATSAPKEGLVLSGEGIQSEITYPKKTPERRSSDLHYPKKK